MCQHLSFLFTKVVDNGVHVARLALIIKSFRESNHAVTADTLPRWEDRFVCHLYGHRVDSLRDGFVGPHPFGNGLLRCCADWRQVLHIKLDKFGFPLDRHCRTQWFCILRRNRWR